MTSASKVNTEKSQQPQVLINKLHKILHFGWLTSFFDLIGKNPDLLGEPEFHALLTQSAQQIDKQSRNKITKLLTTARQFGKRSKIFYRLAWGVYLLEAASSISACGLTTASFRSQHPFCRLLHIGFIPHLLSVEAIFTWSSWLLLAIPYFVLRVRSIRTTRQALDIVEQGSMGNKRTRVKTEK